MYAAMENKTAIIEKMLDLGCDIQAKNKEHYSTLHLASMYSREETIKLLLNKKADPTLVGGVRSKHTIFAFVVDITQVLIEVLLINDE